MQPTQVLESCLCVTDLEAAERFYTQVLGLVLLTKQPGRHLFFRCGQQMVLLFNAAESQKPLGDIPPHGSSGAGHLCFAAAMSDLPQWQTQLARHNVPLETSYDWPGGGRSLYFRDPSGNSLEIATPRIWGLPESA